MPLVIASNLKPVFKCFVVKLVFFSKPLSLFLIFLYLNNIFVEHFFKFLNNFIFSVLMRNLLEIYQELG